MQQSLLQNRLLALLPDEDLWLLQPDLEHIDWKRGDVHAEAEIPHIYMYFPITGFVSIVVNTPADRGVQVGIYGRDGVGPTSIILGVDQTPHRYIVQVDGAAWRLPIRKFADATSRSASLHLLLMNYLHVVTVQMSYTAQSGSSNSIGERLARLLLMCHDRLSGDVIDLTHEALSFMLGVRRPGVTNAIHVLEGVKIVRATRGQVRVLDRPRLEEAAGESYGVPEAEYRRLIGPC